MRRVLRGLGDCAQEGFPNYFGEISGIHRARRVVHKHGTFLHSNTHFVHSDGDVPVDMA